MPACNLSKAQTLHLNPQQAQAETFTPEDAQTLRLPDDAEKARLQDPLSRLENSERDKSVARNEAVRHMPVLACFASGRLLPKHGNSAGWRRASAAWACSFVPVAGLGVRQHPAC